MEAWFLTNGKTVSAIIASAIVLLKQLSLQCIGAIGSTHVRMKQPSCSSHSDYVNQKGNCTINCQAAADYRYFFFDIFVKSFGSVHDARIFSKSSFSLQLNDRIISFVQELL